MPNYTGNLNLAKPIPMEDAADIQVINENMDKIDTWSMDIDEKTKAATSEIPGIVKYGTEAATALEGSKLAEILGIEYGGVLNNNNQKVAGKGYYDTANKKIYKCTANTSINYADAGYFIEVSNNDLLGKLQNLIKIKNEIKTPASFISNIDIYNNEILATFKDSDLIYVVCDGNNGGEGYAYITPVSLFRVGMGTRVSIQLLDSPTNARISLGIKSNGTLNLTCSDSSTVYLRYACIISSI